MDMVTLKRFEVWLVNLAPTIGSEISKSRPCVIVSPDEANMYLNTVIVVPLTSTLRSYPTRVDCTFQEKQGQLAIDQIRTIDKQRLFKKLGTIDEPTCRTLCATIEETFKH
jgi:mRNA interferase MazF